MNLFSVDMTFIEDSLKSFTSQELEAYEEYLRRLLSADLLMKEDAMESACYRVIQERGGLR